MEKFKTETDKDLATRIWESEKKQEVIKQVDKLLLEWQDLNTEQQIKRLDSLLHSLAILDSKDRKLCVKKLSEGKIVSKKGATTVIDKAREALGIEDEAKNKEDKPIYTAHFDGLVDIVEFNSLPAFLVKEDGNLSILPKIRKNNKIFIPPPKKQIPWLLPRGEAILDFFSNDVVLGNEKANSILYDDLLNYHKGISELPSEEYYDLIVAWDFHTYHLEPSRYSPIICLFAVPERGKTRTGQGMIYVAYRSIHLESLRDAYLVRVANDLRATLFFDVRDIWRKAEHNGTEDILLHRFERGAKVPRVLHPDRGAHRDMVYYSVFGATIISTNEGVHRILETRAIQINMPESNRRFENDVTPEFALSLKERLVAFKARHLGEKFQDIIKPASGRLGDILKPLQQIICLVKPEKEKSFLKLAKALEKGRLMEKADTLEAQILDEVIKHKEDTINGALPVKKITDALNDGKQEKFQFSYQRIGRRLAAMGFRKAKTRDGASAIIWDEKSIELMKGKYGLKETSVSSEMQRE
ncbi:MAG: hypothetical protein ABIK26_01155 [Candidatus Omnitrophota bacterium]